MKRIMGLLVVAVILAGFSSGLFAATSVNGKVTVRLVANAIGVAFEKDTNDFGTALFNTVIISSGSDQRIIVRNDGAAPIDLKLQITGCTTSWAAGTTPSDNGVDKYSLSAIFNQWDLNLLPADFGSEDIVLSGSPTTASATVFARAGDDISLKGYNIPSTGGNASQRSLKFRLLTPTSTTTSQGNAESITLTVTAVAH